MKASGPNRTLTLTGPSTHVYKLRQAKPRNAGEPHGYFPARVVPEGTVVDLRLFGPCGSAESGRLGFYPDRLIADGYDPDFVGRGEFSEPKGFVLILNPDVPV